MGIVQLYRRHFLAMELAIGLVASLAFAAAIVSWWSCDEIGAKLEQSRDQFFPVVATISGTLLGFVITGISIILAFMETGKFELLKNSRHYHEIYSIYLSTIKFLALTTILAVSAIVVNTDLLTPVSLLLMTALIISGLRVWRCIWILTNIVTILRMREKQD